jgi:hypothetical protein
LSGSDPPHHRRLQNLRRSGDLDLSVERLILRPKYANLFSIEERELAFKRLQDAGTG